MDRQHWFVHTDFDGTDDERSVVQLAPTSKSFLIADVRLICFHFAAQRLSPGREHFS